VILLAVTLIFLRFFFRREKIRASGTGKRDETFSKSMINSELNDISGCRSKEVSGVWRYEMLIFIWYDVNV